MIDKLTQLQRQGEPRLLVVVGSSGSGKSSLARRVSCHDCVRTARVGRRRAVSAESRSDRRIGQVMSLTFQEARKDVDWKEIRERLLKEAGAANPDADGNFASLGDYAHDLTMASGRREASVSLLVDQAEELLQDSMSQESMQF